MKLALEELKNLVHGAYDIKNTQEGYMYFTRYTDEQLEYLKFNKMFYERAQFSSSVTLEFVTTATKFGFLYKFLLIGSIDSLDVYIDGKTAYIQKLKDLPTEGEMSFSLPAGEKHVVVYFPIDMQFSFKDFYIDGSFCAKSDKKTKVLWIGDSITQGYGSAYTSHTYVNTANRLLGYEILNQGIGGGYYDYKVLKHMPNFIPDKIIVALGINGHINPNKEKMIGDYYKTLTKLYPSVPILAITPLWAQADWVEWQGVIDTQQLIIQNGEKYSQMQVINGFELIPHVHEYFIDGVHPNELGMELYSQNLVKKIVKIGF